MLSSRSDLATVCYLHPPALCRCVSSYARSLCNAGTRTLELHRECIPLHLREVTAQSRKHSALALARAAHARTRECTRLQRGFHAPCRLNSRIHRQPTEYCYARYVGQCKGRSRWKAINCDGERVARARIYTHA